MIRHRFNKAGLDWLASFLDGFEGGAPPEYDSTVLTNPELVEEVSSSSNVPAVIPEGRYEAAQLLVQLLRPVSGREHAIEHDVGLWAWLAYRWFESLCPRNKAGQLDPKDPARWIPQVDDARRYYRHLLLGPYLIMRAHAGNTESVRAILATPLRAPGEVAEQFAANPRLVTSASACGIATHLYWDPAGKLRPGAGGKGGGSARRLVRVLLQLDRTYDLNAIPVERLLGLLPNEFDRFRI